MKRLLLVCYYFPPAAGGGVGRALSFARYLPRSGWSVTVVCADPESAPLADDSRVLGLPAKTEVIRVPMPAGLARGRRAVLGSGAQRPSALYRFTREVASWLLIPDSFAPWRERAGRVVAERLHKGDITAVLTTSPPDTVHLVGLDARPRGGPPWVADFRDPWIGLTYKRPPTTWHAALQARQRDSVLGAADLVLATTKSAGDLLRSWMPAERRPRVRELPNGWEDDVAQAPAKQATSAGPIRLVYTGTLWDVPAARTCLEGLARARASGTASGPASGAASPAGRALSLDLVGPHESTERELASRLGLEDAVHFRGQVPYAESRRWQAEADVLLLLQVHGPGYEHAIPGKLYEYIASGRPILALLPPSEAADLVRAAGGWVVGPDDVSGAATAFARLAAGERPGGASPERDALASAHRRDRLVERLAGWLDQLTSPAQ